MNSKNIKSQLVKNLFVENTSYGNVVNMTIMFGVVCVGWILFRANNLSDAGYILTHGVTGTFESVYNVVFLSGSIRDALIGNGLGISGSGFVFCLALIALMETVHFMQGRLDIEEWFTARPIAVRWAVYYSAILVMIFLAPTAGQQFIYFQF